LPLALQLNYPQIKNSPEISDWLSKFDEKRVVAMKMLMRLRFVEESTLSTWLKNELIAEAAIGPAAVFSVRKLRNEVDDVWNESGEFLDRPGHSLGSEDLIQGHVANLVKGKTHLLDHPSINLIKANRIEKIVLVDDSIGSGRRVAKFIKRMFANKTFLSRWSLGKLRISIVAFARILEAEKVILAEVKGSNHAIRKFPAHSKIQIKSHFVSRKNNLFQTWGPNYQEMLDLCDACDGVKYNRRRGFGDSMANLVFAHSVPNNLPGLFWFQSNNWDALFPRREVPTWLYPLLKTRHSIPHATLQVEASDCSDDLIRALTLIARKGLRRDSTIARQLGLDVKVVSHLLVKAIGRGLLTPSHRMTVAGRSLVKKRVKKKVYNREMYMPKSWCADQTVQPSTSNRVNEG